MTDNEEFKKNVVGFIEKMEPEKMYLISAICLPENRERFILEVKKYMDSHAWQGNLNFNADYTKIYKLHPVPQQALDRYMNEHRSH